MSSKTYEIDLMAEVIMNALMEYSAEATRITKTEVKLAAKECAKGIRSESQTKFGGTGKYASGWTYKKVFENEEDVRYEVFNNTQPTLTHLLEYGHEKWFMGHHLQPPVPGRSHIRPVADAIGDDLAEHIKLRLG